jgi:hypothetical protein
MLTRTPELVTFAPLSIDMGSGRESRCLVPEDVRWLLVGASAGILREIAQACPRRRSSSLEQERDQGRDSVGGLVTGGSPSHY